MKKFQLSLIITNLLLINLIGQNDINPDGYNKIYYPNGKILSEGLMKDSKPEGYWKSYFTTGILKSEGNRKNFLLDSIWIFYNSSGDTLQKFSYMLGKKNGYCYQYNTDKSKPDEIGKIISKELYVNDSKEGKSFYYNKEKLSEEVNYKDNKKDGLSIEYDNERIITIKRYNKGSIVEREKINRFNENNNKDGTWKFFFEGIKIQVEENYKNGLLDGYHKEYDTKGNLLLTLLYRDGNLINDTSSNEKPVIVKEVKDVNGNILESGPYLDDFKVGLHKKFDKNGNVINSYIYNNYGVLLSEGIVDKEGKREGSWKDLYSDGKLKAEGNYKNNLREGKWSFFFNDGGIEQLGYYKNGKETGDWKWYYSTGKCWKEENFYNGLRDGISIEYDINGNILVSGSYIEGEMEGDWIIKINDFIAKGKYVLGLKDGVWRYYFNDNTLLFEGEFIQGNPEGKHRYYYPEKILKEEQFFSNGIPDKLWKKYDEEGNLIVTITYENGKEYRINGIRIDLQDEKIMIK
jgi:uncharacterized protein